MNDIDFERASTLINIIAQISNIVPGPGAAHILGEAQAELKEIDALCKENVDERAAEEAKKAQDEAEEVEEAEDNPPPPRKEEEPKYVAPKPDPKPAPAATWKPDQEPKPESNGRRA